MTTEPTPDPQALSTGPKETRERRKPRPRMPPRLTEEQRLRQARGWLIRCGQPPAPDRVAQLMPFVGRYRRGGLYGAVADTLVSRGELPTVAAIQAFLAEARQPTARLPVGVTEADAWAAVGWIDGSVTAHGQGPLWSEVAHQHGWTKAEVERILPWLRKRGAVEYTNQTRSLRALRASIIDASWEETGVLSGSIPAQEPVNEVG